VTDTPSGRAPAFKAVPSDAALGVQDQHDIRRRWVVYHRRWTAFTGGALHRGSPCAPTWHPSRSSRS
jgi:hypothetical protein